MAKTVKIWNNNFETVLTDIKNLTFLDYDEETPQVRTNTMEVKGKDGVLIGESSFAPFQLILRFYYAGADTEDYNLMKTRLRNILFRKDVFYLNHSDAPGKKYACYTEDQGIEDIADRYGTFEITFNVYKGYSESLKDTLNIDFLTDDFQFESGVITDDISYRKTTRRFSIWNGGLEIDPLNHKLIISIKGTCSNGFKMTNMMTQETFQYYGALSGTPLVLNGVHPSIGSNRVGIQTNWEWCTLQSGWNNFEIEGSGLTIEEVQFQFDFIYR